MIIKTEIIRLQLPDTDYAHNRYRGLFLLDRGSFKEYVVWYIDEHDNTYSGHYFTPTLQGLQEALNLLKGDKS